jgi:Leucine-rich repeat (LRR) protein
LLHVRLQVAAVQSYLPNLQELHAAGNHFSSLQVHLEQPSQQETPSQQEQHPQQQQDWPSLAGFKSLQVCHVLPTVGIGFWTVPNLATTPSPSLCAPEQQQDTLHC